DFCRQEPSRVELHGFDVRSVLTDSPFQAEEAFDLGHGMLEPPAICQCSLPFHALRATFSQVWTCGEPRKYHEKAGPSSFQMSQTPSLPISPSLKYVRRSLSAPPAASRHSRTSAASQARKGRSIISRVWKILLACSPWYHQTLLVCLASSLKCPSAA